MDNTDARDCGRQLAGLGKPRKSVGWGWGGLRKGPKEREREARVKRESRERQTCWPGLRCLLWQKRVVTFP